MRERDIFIAALERDDLSERAALLEEACRDDSQLRSRVEQLLEEHERQESFILDSPPPGFEATPEQRISERPGTVIGPYKLLEQIGEGGFGVVFMAEQEQPVRRRVALKIIKPGMDTRQVIARFESERQALALMDHPNIAKVLEAGATENGRPYFVMELVRGIPLTEFCDQNCLSVRERLELFMTVCHAAQHAHQKGIIHRDIKPTNVLVTLHDGRPVAKVIDFGVAKATGQRLTERTVFTAFAQMVGTPLYMSPEQAEMSGLDLDTRSDIYSLGVLLYELLTGTTPFDKSRLHEASYDEIRRIIREEEPPKPSTRISTLASAATTVSTQRKSEPDKLRLVRGDLDWIVMKCLEKDRNRRYDTASSLAADVKRHLNNEPVVARPPSAAYRFEKLARRHRVALATSCAFALVCVLGFSGVLWQWRRANFNARAEAAQRLRAEANLQSAREAIDRTFIRVADELAGQPRMEQVRRRLLEDALEFYEGFLQQKGDDPTVRRGAAEAHLRMARIYSKLGQHDKVLEPAAEAIMILADLSALQPHDARYREQMVEAYDVMTFANFSVGRSADGLAHGRTKLAVIADLARDFPTEPKYLLQAADAHVGVGNALRTTEQPNEAVHYFLQALKLYEKRRAEFPDLPEDRCRLAHIHHWFGAVLNEIGQAVEAERHYRESRELRIQLVAEQPQNAQRKHLLSHVEQYLAELLMRTGRLQEAEELLRHAVENDESILSDFPDVGEYRRRAAVDYEFYGRLLAALERVPEAENALRRSLEIRESLVGDFPKVERYGQELVHSWYQLGILLERTNTSSESAEAFREAVGLAEKLLGESPASPELQTLSGWILATCPAAQFRNPSRSVTLLKQALEHRSTSSNTWTLLGVAQYRAGETTSAIESLHRSMDLEDGENAQQWLFLAMSHWQQGDRQLARQWYDKAAAWIEENRPADESYVRFRREAANLLRIDSTNEGRDRHEKEQQAEK